MNFLNIFIGSPQSKYAAFAIIIAIISICLSILFSNSDVTFSQRLTFIIFILIGITPGILLTLFEITCIVTGSGFKNNRWWCNWLAWIIAIILIVYSIIIIITVFISMFSINNAMYLVNNDKKNQENNRVSKEEANEYAHSIIEHFNRY